MGRRKGWDLVGTKKLLMAVYVFGLIQKFIISEVGQTGESLDEPAGDQLRGLTRRLQAEPELACQSRLRSFMSWFSYVFEARVKLMMGSEKQ